jgi:hypothetical protein
VGHRLRRRGEGTLAGQGSMWLKTFKPGITDNAVHPGDSHGRRAGAPATRRVTHALLRPHVDKRSCLPPDGVWDDADHHRYALPERSDQAVIMSEQELPGSLHCG